MANDECLILLLNTIMYIYIYIYKPRFEGQPPQESAFKTSRNGLPPIYTHAKILKLKVYGGWLCPGLHFNSTQYYTILHEYPTFINDHKWKSLSLPSYRNPWDQWYLSNSIYLSMYSSLHLYIYITFSTRLSTYLYLSMLLCIIIYFSAALPTVFMFLPIYVSIYPRFHLSTFLSMFLSISLFIYLSIHLSAYVST